jgi:hypothetical protein
VPNRQFVAHRRRAHQTRRRLLLLVMGAYVHWHEHRTSSRDVRATPNVANRRILNRRFASGGDTVTGGPPCQPTMLADDRWICLRVQAVSASQLIDDQGDAEGDHGDPEAGCSNAYKEHDCSRKSAPTRPDERLLNARPGDRRASCPEMRPDDALARVRSRPILRDQLSEVGVRPAPHFGRAGAYRHQFGHSRSRHRLAAPRSGDVRYRPQRGRCRRTSRGSKSERAEMAR